MKQLPFPEPKVCPIQGSSLPKLVATKQDILEELNKDISREFNHDGPGGYPKIVGMVLAYHNPSVAEDKKQFVRNLFQDTLPVISLIFKILNESYMGHLEQDTMNGYLEQYVNLLNTNIGSDSLRLLSMNAKDVTEQQINRLYESLLSVVISTPNLYSFLKVMKIKFSTKGVLQKYESIERQVYLTCASLGRFEILKYFAENKVTDFDLEPTHSKGELHGSLHIFRKQILDRAFFNNRFDFALSFLKEWMFPFDISFESQMPFFSIWKMPVNGSLLLGGPQYSEYTPGALSFLMNCYTIAKQYQEANVSFFDTRILWSIVFKMARNDKYLEGRPSCWFQFILENMQDVPSEERDIIITDILKTLFEKGMCPDHVASSEALSLFKQIALYLPHDAQKRGVYLMGLVTAAMASESTDMNAVYSFIQHHSELDIPLWFESFYMQNHLRSQYTMLINSILSEQSRDEKSWLNPTTSHFVFESLMSVFNRANAGGRLPVFSDMYYRFSLLKTLVVDAKRHHLEVNYLQLTDMLIAIKPVYFIPQRNDWTRFPLREGDTNMVRTIDKIKTPFPGIARSLIVHCLETQIIEVVQRIFQNRERLSQLAYAGLHEYFENMKIFQGYIERQFTLTMGTVFRHLSQKTKGLPSLPAEIWIRAFSLLEGGTDETRAEAAKDLYQASTIYTNTVYQPLMKARKHKVVGARQRDEDNPEEFVRIKRVKF